MYGRGGMGIACHSREFFFASDAAWMSWAVADRDGCKDWRVD